MKHAQLAPRAETLLAQRKYADAARLYRMILRRQSKNVSALVNLAYALINSEAENNEQTLISCRELLLRAYKLAPGQKEVWIGLAEVELQLDNMPGALNAARSALAIAPYDLKVLEQAARVLLKAELPEEAAVCYARALQFEPRNVKFLTGMAAALDNQDKTLLAQTAWLAALKEAPERHELALRIATLCPSIPQSIDEIQLYATQIKQRLEECAGDVALGCLNNHPLRFDDIHRSYPFTTSRHAYYNIAERDIHVLMAKIALKACPSLAWTTPGVNRLGVRDKIRLGVATWFTATHIVGQLAQGIAERFDRQVFEVIGITPPGTPSYIEDARAVFAGAQRHVVLPADLARSREIIAGLDLDVLFVLDTMMHPLIYYLCFARLAPVQCTTWGHPLTSGIPTVDYFLSSSDWEPHCAQEYYSERLVPLDAQPMFIAQPDEQGISLSKHAASDALGLPRDKRLYVCPQSLFKLHPDFDWALVQILRRDQDALVVLLHGARLAWSRRILERIGRAAPDVTARICFAKRGPRDLFLNLYRMADAVLDPFHWSGGNTTIEALAAGQPVVTLPGQFMRGRLSLGFYKAMGMPELVVRDAEEFVNANIQIANDPALKRRLSEKIAERLPAICQDPAGVKELENFFVAVCRGEQPYRPSNPIDYEQT